MRSWKKWSVAALLVLGTACCVQHVDAQDAGDEDEEAVGYSYQPEPSPSNRPKSNSTPESLISTSGYRGAEGRKQAAQAMKFLGKSLEQLGGQVKRGDGSVSGAVGGSVLGELMKVIGKSATAQADENAENELGFIPWKRTTPYRFGKDEVILRIVIERLTNVEGLVLPQKLMHSLTQAEVLSISKGQSGPIKEYLAAALQEISKHVRQGTSLRVKLTPFLDDYHEVNGVRPTFGLQIGQPVEEWISKRGSVRQDQEK